MNPSDPKSNDEELMSAYLGGDLRAFEELYRRHSGRVYGYLRRRLPRPEEVDEVFQAVFLKAHRSRHGFDFKYTFSQWIYVITKTQLLDHVRAQGRQPELTGEYSENLSQTDPNPSFTGERDLPALGHLTADQRAVVELRVFDELSYEEISRKLGRTQQSVRQILSRALRKLKTEWKG